MLLRVCFSAKTILRELIQIHRLFAVIAALCSPEKLVSAIRAVVALFFGLHPFFCSHLTPLRYSPQNDLLTHGNRKIVDVFTGKFIALMAPFMAFLLGTGPDSAFGAVGKHLAG